MRQKLEIIYNEDVEVNFSHLCQVLCVTFGVVLYQDQNGVYTGFVPKEKVEAILKYMRKFKDFESTARVIITNEA